MSNNALLVNAALGGALGGMVQGTGFQQVDPVPLIQVNAKAFAVAIDLVIPNLPLISDLAGAPRVPTNALITANQNAATSIMRSISYGYWAQRGNPGAAVSVNVSAATALAAIASEAFDVRVAT